MICCRKAQNISLITTNKTNTENQLIVRMNKMQISIPHDRHLKKLKPFIIFLLFIAISLSIRGMMYDFSKPILDMFSFRQTQTAISVLWMIKEGHYLNYQTPVLGFPWSIPFEFPLYQWMVLFIYL